MLTLVFVDLLALALATGLSVWIRFKLGGEYDPAMYWKFWPVLGLFVIVYYAARLYAVPVCPAEEIRRVTLLTTAMYLGLATATFLMKESEVYSRSIFVLALPSSILLVLMGRAVTRLALSSRSWWGAPVLLLGCGRNGRRLVRMILSNPEMGLKPVGILDDRPWRGHGFRGVPVLGTTARAVELVRSHRRLRLLVNVSEIPRERLDELMLQEQQHIGHLIIIPNLAGLTSIGVGAQDMGGILGLHVRHRLLDPVQRLNKRALDIAMMLLLIPVVGLATLILAALIKLDSPGPLFIGHKRIGLGGKYFKCWKFRTMVANASEALTQMLADNPEAAKQWARDHKLRHDPRVTRLGRFLRRTSLDELPQFWNVLCGQMSIVGPRPIIEEEVERYGRNFTLYTHVRPGITGLWQVSGRNNLPYADRVRLDIHYVRNWSIWLDLYILSRTILEVITGRGAY